MLVKLQKVWALDVLPVNGGMKCNPGIAFGLFSLTTQFQSRCIIHQSAVDGTEQIVFIVQMASHKSHFIAFCTNSVITGSKMSSAEDK